MRRLLPTLFLALSLSCGLAVACNPTAGVPVAASLTLESLAEGRLMTASGWDVELTEAALLLGPIYAYGPEPVAALVPWPGLPSVAHAHGGFDGLSGRVRAEYLEQRAFDALSPDPVDLGAIFAVQGAVDEVHLVLDAPRGEYARDNGPTHGHHVWVSGVARRADDSVSFEGGLDLEDAGLTRRVAGVTADGALDDGATLVVGVDPTVWLLEADFSELVGDETPAVFGPDSQPLRALRLGARTSAAYAARIDERETR